MDSSNEVKRLVKRITRDFDEWTVLPSMVNSFLKKPQTKLGHFIETGDDDVLIDLETSRLHTWHYTRFAAAFLNQKTYLTDEFALATHYAVWTVLFSETLARRDRGGDLVEDTAAFYFAMPIIAGWPRESIALGDALLEGLDNPMLDLRINDQHESGVLFPHFWFLMHLYTSWRGYKPIDISRYSYPESMAPYAQVLEDWRTEDVSKVQRWVEEMAEHHVQKTDDADPDGKNEFDFDRAKLFPYEIFAFLRLREWLKLPNPTSFEHPLMNQPLGYLPQPLPDGGPAIPLLDQVIERYRQDFPDLRRIGV